MWNASRIRELRGRLGISQAEFAELLGCRQQTVSEWETGAYFPGNAYGKLLDALTLRMPLSSASVSGSAPSENRRIFSASSMVSTEPEKVEFFQSRSDFDAAID